MNTSIITRKFKFDDNIFDDFNPNFSVDEIKTHLCGSYPELTNAIIENKGLQEDNSLLYEFKLVLGTKA